MPRSWKPFDRPFVVNVSPDPDLEVDCALRSTLPMAASSCENTVSLSPSTDPDVPGLILMNPPALKKCLKASAEPKVIDLSIVEVEFHVPELVLEPAACDEIAVAPVDPPATADARLARSVINADLIAMVSPAETDDAVIEVLVWFAMLSMPVNSEFQCEACTVLPALTVEMLDCPSPYSPEPVPAKWL